MITWWPGQIAAGSRTDHISAFWDVIPTLAEVAKVNVPGNIDGISFLPTLLGEPGQESHAYLYWEFHEKRGRVAIRKGFWKGVRYDVSVDPHSTLELYDLSRDIGEEFNVAAMYPEVVIKLDELLAQARTVSPIQRFNFPQRVKSLIHWEKAPENK